MGVYLGQEEWGLCDGTCDLLRIDEEDGFSPPCEDKSEKVADHKLGRGPSPRTKTIRIFDLGLSDLQNCEK